MLRIGLSESHALLELFKLYMYLTTCAAGVPLLHYTKSYRWLECEFRHLSSQILRLTNPRIFLVRYLLLLAQFIMLTCNLHDRCMVDVCAAFVPPAITLCFEELSLHRMHCEGVSQLMCLSALRVPPAETRLTVYCRLQVPAQKHRGSHTAGKK